MKSYSIQQKPCQFIAEGCSYQLQRYKNNLKKQMILQENRKIDRNRLHPAQNNWHKSHSRFYPSPTLHPPFTLYPPVFICNCILTFSFLSQESKILPCQGQHFAPIRHKTKRRDRKKYTTGRLFFSSKRISAFSEGTDRKP